MIDIQDSINRLRKVIRGRTVAVLLAGASIYELERRIGELKDCDLCYAAVNHFWVIEGGILSKVGKKLSVVLCSAPENNLPTERHIEYLERPEDNMLITETISFYPSPELDLNEFVRLYWQKLLFFVAAHVMVSTPEEREAGALALPSAQRPLHFPALASMSILLGLLIIGGASRIVLFGADGGRIGKKFYYAGWNAEIDHFEERIVHDALQINEVMDIILGNVYKLYGIEPIRIINCSPKSHYTAFEKLSYNETIRLLQGRA